MVPVLVADVPDHLLLVRGAHRESALSRLPGKAPVIPKLLVDPPRRIGFHDAQASCYCDIGWQASQHVNVAPRAIYQSCCAAHLANYAAHVSEEIGAELCVHRADAVLGAEYYVNQQG